MQNKKLYIIGNGFDLHHGMKTNYSCFHSWLKVNGYISVLNLLSQIISNEGKQVLWSNFEKALGKYKIESVSSWGFCNARIGVFEEVELMSASLKNARFIVTPEPVVCMDIFTLINDAFSKWINSIEIVGYSDVELDKDACFLNFNYTSTLQDLYGIAEKNICYIHGCIRNGDRLIVGHNSDIIDSVKLCSNKIEVRPNDNKIQNIESMNDLRKDTSQIISSHKTFFVNLTDISEVIVLGHSCSDVDEEYFLEVKSNVQKDARWKFSYYSEQDKEHVENFIEKLNLNAVLFKF